jgi:hypothetical protein
MSAPREADAAFAAAPDTVDSLAIVEGYGPDGGDGFIADECTGRRGS